MQMNPEVKQRIQLVLAVAILVSGTRLAYVLYQRHESTVEQAKKQAPPLNPDYYVTPKKLYLYDLKSARQLAGQTAWVKVGYGYTFYPYDSPRHRTDFLHEAGKLLPRDLAIWGHDLYVGRIPCLGRWTGAAVQIFQKGVAHAQGGNGLRKRGSNDFVRVLHDQGIAKSDV